MAARPGIPSTWPELVEQAHEARERSEGVLRYLLERAARRRGGALPGRLSVPAASLARTATLLGPAEAAPLFAAAEELLPEAIDACREGPSKQSCLGCLAVLSYLNVGRSVGATRYAEGGRLEALWIPALAELKRELDEGERQRAAFAALAGAEGAALARLARVTLLRRPPPGQTFGFDVQGYLRYMASAAAASADAEAVRPAWHDFVRHFPHKLGASTLSFVELMCAARAYYVTFEAVAPERVAQRVHELVTANGF